jgi:hypothetical protein
MKIKEAAPDYVKKLRTELNVEIVDPALLTKTLDEKVQQQASAAEAGAAAPAVAPLVKLFNRMTALTVKVNL